MNSVAATSVHVGPGEIVYRSITALGWLLVNVGCVFGIYGGFFLLLGQASVSGFMVNLNNLAARYVAADAMRQASFDQLVSIFSRL